MFRQHNFSQNSMSKQRLSGLSVKTRVLAKAPNLSKTKSPENFGSVSVWSLDCCHAACSFFLSLTDGLLVGVHELRLGHLAGGHLERVVVGGAGCQFNRMEKSLKNWPKKSPQKIAQESNWKGYRWKFLIVSIRKSPKWPRKSPKLSPKKSPKKSQRKYLCYWIASQEGIHLQLVSVSCSTSKAVLSTISVASLISEWTSWSLDSSHNSSHDSL